MLRFRVDPKNVCISTILKMLTEEGTSEVGKLELPEHWLYFSPPWTQEQRSLFIESIFIRMPMQPFYFVEYPNERSRIMDGLQRILAMRDFAESKLVLTHLDYEHDAVKDKTIEQIPFYLTRRFLEAYVTLYITDPSMPDDLVCNMVDRLFASDMLSKVAPESLGARKLYLCLYPVTLADLASDSELPMFVADK